jgi:hypothetical protein
MPYEMLAGLESSKIIMSRFHTFGCPCYVLDQRLKKEMGPLQNGSLMLGWVFMMVDHHHMLLMLHLSLIQGQAMSHLNFTLSLMTTLPQCHIFALALFLHIGRILSFHLLQLRCILKNKWEPGNWSLTGKSTVETLLGKINLYPLLIKIVRERNAELCSVVTTNSNLGVSFVDQPGIVNTPIAVSDSSQNLWHMPTPINLDYSGLCCSSRAAVLNRRGKVYSSTTTLTNQNSSSLHSASIQTTSLHLASTQTTNLCSPSSPSFKSALVSFSTICPFGYILSCMAHSLKEKVTVTSNQHSQMLLTVTMV